MKAKKWINILLIISILFILIVIVINYIVDPLWTFSHSNNFNQKQNGFDERQQKTNYIYEKHLNNFDGILLGSSRATLINQNDFEDMNIYNYSVSSMLPYEYKGYIDFAKKIKGEDFKYIIIGSDFFGTNKLKEIKTQDSSYYINNTMTTFYKYKMLVSLELLKKSFTNIKISLFDAKNYYDRNNIHYQNKLSEIERKKRFDENIKIHTIEFMRSNYTYDNNYINILKQLKNDNPNSKFIIFTSPISADLLVSIIKNGEKINEYERWLKELVDIFGEVNHFMTINSITKNLQNYPDDDHAYPYILKLLANKLSNTKNNNLPEDFGILLTNKNIHEHIENLKKQIENYNLLAPKKEDIK